MQHQRQILRITAALLSIALFGLNSSFAQVLWTGTTSVNDDWFTPTNWTGSTIPADTDDVRLNSGSTEANPIVINSGTTALASALTVAFGNSDSGYLEIRSNLTVTGLFSMRSGIGTITQFSGTVSAGEINTGARSGTFNYVLNGASAVLQTTGAGDFYVARGDGNTEFKHDAGTVTVGKNMYLGSSIYTGNSGKYLMTSGTLSVAGQMRVGWKADGQSFEQSGGTSIFGSVVAGGNADDPGVGTIKLSEGAQFTSSGLMRIADSGTSSPGTGTLILDGSKTGSGTDLIAEDDFQLNNLGTLNVVIDNDAITLASNMRKVDITQDIVFELGSLLLPEFGSGVTPTAGTWTIAAWSGSMTNNGLALDPGTAAGWSFDASDISKTLTVTYVVPEPSAVLLLVGGIGFLIARRRR